MNENYRTELRRVFLLQNLPAPLTRASEHLQFFDNYIENTRLRLRSIRAPHTKKWHWILEQRFPANENDLSVWNVSEIYLSETEHAAFEIFEGREVKKNERVETGELRFNRYFHNVENKRMEIDFFLNPLWGLILGKVFFETSEEMRNFKKPDFVIAETTQNENFLGRNLVGKTLEELQSEFKAQNLKNIKP